MRVKTLIEYHDEAFIINPGTELIIEFFKPNNPVDIIYVRAVGINSGFPFPVRAEFIKKALRTLGLIEVGVTQG